MTDVSQVFTPEWAQKKPDQSPILYENWTRSEQEPQDLAWGSDGLRAKVAEEEVPEEPEIRECPLCEETKEASAAELAQKVQEMEVRLDSAVADFTSALDGISRSVDGDVVRLAKLLAERIIGESVQLDPTLLERNLANALRQAGPLMTVTLKVNASDLERVREIAPALAEEAAGTPVDVTVHTSADVSKGGVVLVYDAGLIDARFEHQLESLTMVVADMVAQGDGRQAPLATSSNEATEVALGDPAPAVAPIEDGEGES